MKYSKLSNDFVGQGMFQILETAKELERQGKNLVHFELGDPDFDTPENIKDIAIKAIKTNHTHYVESAGIYSLRKAACTTTLRSRYFLPDVDQTLVTCGANMQIYLALACLANLGDEIIIPNPYFPTYMATINALGLIAIEVKCLEKNNFHMKAEDIERCISSRTRAIIINSPSNPTGAVLSQKDIEEIYDVCKKHDLWLISDEVYSRQIYVGKFFSPSMIDKCNERVVLVNGFSKSFAMTGWRLGVVTAPKDLIKRMQLLLETIISCVPPFIQIAGTAALLNDQTEVQEMHKQYKQRMEMMVNGINEINELKCFVPQGALYCWVKIPFDFIAADFFKLLLDKGVVVCPGDIFGREGYVRLCFCTSEENIKEGLKRISEWKQ
jgi:aspartate aminotransferase